jgi:hypothetical protein
VKGERRVTKQSPEEARETDEGPAIFVTRPREQGVAGGEEIRGKRGAVGLDERGSDRY